MDPAVMPSIMGPTICSNGAMKPRGSSWSGVGGGWSGSWSDRASVSNRGRQASRVAETHWPRVTGVIVRPRPLVEAGRPVAAPTWSSATRAICSILIRSSGSTLPSWPPSVATV